MQTKTKYINSQIASYQANNMEEAYKSKYDKL